MRSHITRSCQPVLSHLDNGNATLAGIPNTFFGGSSPTKYCLLWMQQLDLFTRRLFIRRLGLAISLHFFINFNAKERIDFKLAVLVYIKVPSYLADDLSRSAASQAWCKLRSVSLSSINVRRTHLSTVGNRSFPVAVSRVWNGLPQHVTAAPSLTVFCSSLKTHMFSVSFP